MKKIIALVVLFMIFLTGCSAQNSGSSDLYGDMPVTSKESLESGEIFSEEPASVDPWLSKDLNNFGFNDIEEGTVWLEVEGVEQSSFDDPDNAYVVCESGEYFTWTFNNGFIVRDLWHSMFEGNYNILYEKDKQFGSVGVLSQSYRIINNYSISIDSGRAGGNTMTINDVTLKGKVPFVICHESNWRDSISGGRFICTDVIDWSRSPEKMTTDEYGYYTVKYYIKPEYAK